MAFSVGSLSLWIHLDGHCSFCFRFQANCFLFLFFFIHFLLLSCSGCHWFLAMVVVVNERALLIFVRPQRRAAGNDIIIRASLIRPARTNDLRYLVDLVAVSLIENVLLTMQIPLTADRNLSETVPIDDTETTRKFLQSIDSDNVQIVLSCLLPQRWQSNVSIIFTCSPNGTISRRFCSPSGNSPPQHIPTHANRESRFDWHNRVNVIRWLGRSIISRLPVQLVLIVWPQLKVARRPKCHASRWIVR